MNATCLAPLLRWAVLAVLLAAAPLSAQQPQQAAPPAAQSSQAAPSPPAAPPAPSSTANLSGDQSAEAARRQVTQPLNNAPVWREVRSGQPQSTTLPGVGNAVLIQSSGETWREVRPPIALIGGSIFGLALLGLALFYAFRGPLTPEERPTGRVIERFPPPDRYAHWLLAICWVTLAVTGLVLSLGKTLLLPLIGYTLFSWLATLSKTVHNFVGPVLVVAVPWMFVRFVRDNGIGVDDFRWFANLGGYFRGHEMPSQRFNAGEKIVFWIVLVLLSSVLVVTGLILNFPNFGQERSTMQLSNVVHMVAAYIAIALASVHIYLGTVGVTGAYEAMRYGYVDETWARHHHALWYERVKAGRAREKFVEPGGPAVVDEEALRGGSGVAGVRS